MTGPRLADPGLARMHFGHLFHILSCYPVATGDSTLKEVAGPVPKPGRHGEELVGSID